MAIRKIWREAGKKTFSTILAGDVYPREAQFDYVISHADDIVREIKYAFKPEALKILQWECAVTEKGEPIVKSGPNLRCPEKVLDLAAALDIDVALLANNHTGDFGASEIMPTIEAIEKRKIKTVGAGCNASEAAKPLLVEKNGIRLAILNICENEFGGARKNLPGTNTMDLLTNIRQIKTAKTQADVVLVTLHGGHEYNPYPSRRMVQAFRAFAEAGADAVWNCHTHCPEGFEVWNGVPIIYSPGNFYFPGHPTSLPTWRAGYLTEFLFDENGVYGMELTPYGATAEKVFPLVPPILEQAEAYLEELCKPLADLDEIDSLFESWCTRAGVGYMGCVNRTSSENYPPDWNDPKTVAHWIGVRNLFTCESHAYLLRQLSFLIEEGRMDEASAGYDRIEKMQTPDFITW